MTRPYFLRAKGEWLWWAGCAVVALTISLLLTECAFAGDYWFKTGQGVTEAPIVYVDEVTCGEYQNALGCFLEIWGGHAGVIVVKKGLPAWVEWCVVEHEKKHAAGYRHIIGLPFADCGDGTWVTWAALTEWTR